MELSPATLLAHARSDEGKKQLRYVGVSVVFVPLGQIMIQVFAHVVLDDSMSDTARYTSASLLTAAILTLPNFFANKLWVWKVTSKDNLRTQVVVFWVAAMLGVTFATTLTFVVSEATKNQAGLVRGLSVVVAQLAGFGLVWVGRFLVLDKWLFKVTHGGEEPSPEEVDDLHHEFPI